MNLMDDALQRNGQASQTSPDSTESTVLRAFADSVPALFWQASSSGILQTMNAHFAEYTGSDSDDRAPTSLRDIVHPDDLPRLDPTRSDDPSSEAGSIELRLRRGDGVYQWFLVRVEPMEDESGTIGWSGLTLDLERQKTAERLLRERENEFRTITDAVSQYIVVLRPDGEVTYVNRAAIEQTGLLGHDVSSQAGGFARPFHPDDLERVSAERKDCLLKGKHFELEVRVLLKSDEYRWYLMQYNPLKDDEGKVVRWYVTGTDIDERKRERDQLRLENIALREDLQSALISGDIVGVSEPIHRVLRQIRQVAKSDSTVLVLGETGTGKELVARGLHGLSERRKKPFIRVNCAAIPQSLISSELFGHEKGAFTGALQRRQGKFEAADGGTLFLDEVGDLPMETQVALLRVLQEREFERIGSNVPISVDIRLIAATHRDLSKEVTEGRFREDLFYRLNVLPITVPPLRDRIEDIPLLVEYFVSRHAQKTGKRIGHILKPHLDEMKAYNWPGNIRELQNIIERAVILSDSDTLFFDRSWLIPTREHPLATPSPVKMQGNLSDLVAREIEIIESTLKECNGRISGPTGAAAKLGIPRQTLESRIKKLGIHRQGR